MITSSIASITTQSNRFSFTSGNLPEQVSSLLVEMDERYRHDDSNSYPEPVIYRGLAHDRDQIGEFTLTVDLYNCKCTIDGFTKEGDYQFAWEAPTEDIERAEYIMIQLLEQLLNIHIPKGELAVYWLRPPLGCVLC